MAEPKRCPMCEEIDPGAQERLCAWCRMLLPADRAIFVLYGPGRAEVYCTASCVRAAALTMAPS